MCRYPEGGARAKKSLIWQVVRTNFRTPHTRVYSRLAVYNIPCAKTAACWLLHR